MRDIDSSLFESHSFLPLESSITPQPQSGGFKSSIKRKTLKGNSLLFSELKKISCEGTQKKRECIIKYLKKEGQLKDKSKVISTLQQEGHAIPILQVAVSLSRYDNQFLKQLLDSKSIELKENKESEIYQLNKKLQSDPILSLLSDSEQLKKLPQQPKQPSFIDFKNISPTKITQLLDVEKGKLKKSKSKGFSMIQYPKELKELKKELMSLPYINRYKKQLNMKKQFKQHKLKSIKDEITINSSQYSEIKHVSDLNLSKKSFKKTTIATENSTQLQTTLRKALERRVKTFQISTKDVSLPKLQKLDRSYLSKSLMEIKDGNLNTKYPLENHDDYQYETLRQTGKSSEQNPEDLYSSNRNSLKRKQTIAKNDEKKYWPEYHSFSSYNNKRYVSEIEKLKAKVKSLTQLSEVPSEETLGVYYSLKRLEKNDLKKLQNQSLNEQKNFSNTKYKIKYNSLKESYSKRLKQFTKDKKVRQFQLQQSSYQQQSNLTLNQIKMNNKMLEKIILPKRDDK